ncbi:MAG: hypothetical protein EOM80_02785 [Erysipelotrichia bacterium]|nr:hypothetical protein [Erysipelotrichia bacterium]
MQTDAETRLGDVSLLQFQPHEFGDKIVISCDRTSDYYLELVSLLLISIPFLILVVTMISFLFSLGLIGRILLGAIAGGSFTVAVMLLGNVFQLLRDALRVIVFDPQSGTVTVNYSGFGKILGCKEVFVFADIAGIRINHFATRHFISRSLIEGYEINLIFNNGNIITLFALVKDYERANDFVALVTAKTGISIL